MKGEDMHRAFAVDSKRHTTAQLWWAKYAKWMLCHDVEALRTTEYPQHQLQRLTPEKAIHAYLHHSNSFADLSFVREYFHVDLQHVFAALLNGRAFRKPSPRSPHLLTQLTEDDIEPFAFAWLVWAAPHFAFVPWSFLQVAFRHIPRVDGSDDFGSAANLATFTDRCQKLLFAPNACIRTFAFLEGWTCVQAPQKQDALDILELAAKHDDLTWADRITTHLRDARGDSIF